LPIFQKNGTMWAMKNQESSKGGGKKRTSKRLDKIFMGMIVGGAVGSILGVTLAPKPGKEIRKIIAARGKETFKKISKIIDKRTEKQEEQKEAQKKGFWYFLNRIFIKKEK
jgi:hypothetical protein